MGSCVGFCLTVFWRKGYSPCEVNKTLAVVRSTDREDLFKKKVVDDRDFGFSFVTGFTHQFKQVEKIIRKYWHLLLKDNDLAKVLPNKPQFIYTKPPTLRMRLAPNVVDPPKKTCTFLDRVVFFLVVGDV